MFKDELLNHINQLDGQVALKVKFLGTNEEININEEAQFWAASVIKVPIAATFYKKVKNKEIEENARCRISNENIVLGSGVAKLLSRDTDFSAKDLVTLMLTISDNSATNQVIDLVGPENVESYMAEIGLNNTTFKHKMMIAAGRGPNLTTAQDMSVLLEKLYKSELPGSDEILSIMQEQMDRTRIPLYIPNDIKIAHKYGSLPQALHEVGIVYSENPFIFCFFSDDQKDKRKTNEVLSQCARLCYEHSNNK
jgi:beta-lactamase class A